MKTAVTPRKYQTVHDEILLRMQSGQYSIGNRLPTEELLAKTFDVSRVTIRKALDMLVRAGYLTARQGSGYVVSTLSPPSRTCMVSFTDHVVNEGRVPGAKLVALENPTKRIPDDVKALFDEPLVLIERLRTIDGNPRMLTRTWIPVRYAPTMSANDFPETGQGQSILRVMRKTFGIQWTSACETLDCIFAEGQISKQLSIDSNTPILSQACTALDDDGNAVFFDQVYRQGPIKFDLTGGNTRQISA